MDASNFWWIAAVVLVGLELATGTFYLLMLSLGMAAAALAAYFGVSSTMQIGIAAGVGTASAVALYAWRRSRGTASAVADQSQNTLDYGQSVAVTADALTALGATVQYRGTQWQAQSDDGSPLNPGRYTITRVEGNHLIIAPSAPAAKSSAGS